MMGLGEIRLWRGRNVKDRVRLMFGQVFKSIRDPLTRHLATTMIVEAGCPAQNLQQVSPQQIDECQVSAIFWAFKQNGRYVGDVRHLDTYQTVKRTSQLGSIEVLAAVVQAMRGQIRQDWRKTLDVATPKQPTFIFDCDDATIALCALLISVGFRAGAKVVSADGREYGHVYTVCELPRVPNGMARQIVPLDATEAEAYPGWEAPPQYRRAERIFWYTE